MNINTDLSTNKRLFVGDGVPEVLGRGEQAVSGSAYIQGPTIIGGDNGFEELSDYESASLMVSEIENNEMKVQPFYSLM